MTANPVPHGLPTRQRRRRGPKVVPLVRGVRRLPRIIDPAEADRLVGALRTQRDRAIVQAMLMAGLRQCEVLALRLEDLRLASGLSSSPTARAATNGWCRSRRRSSTAWPPMHLGDDWLAEEYRRAVGAIDTATDIGPTR